MNEFVKFFSDNQIVEATANFFGIVAGLFIFFNVIKFIYNLFNNIYYMNIKIAFQIVKNNQVIEALKCARDLHRFISRLLLLIIIFHMSILGVIFILISISIKTENYLQIQFNSQKYFANFETYQSFYQLFDVIIYFSMLISLTMSAFMAANLSRNVMRIRARWRKRARI